MGRNIPKEWAQAYRKIFWEVNHREPNSESGEVLDRRTAFALHVLSKAGVIEKGRSLVDLGSGMSWLGPIASQLGLDVTLIDDFGGGGGLDLQVYRSQSLGLANIYREKFEIDIVEQDLIANPLPFSDNTIDIITCSHVLEHWHHSPKRLFGEIHRSLRAGGYFLLVTPNAVNLRKRIWVLFGKTNYCDLSGWYDPEVFRGHVREPVLADLRQLVQWNDFNVVKSYGRNFIGAYSHKLPWLGPSTIRRLVEIGDNVVKFFPTLCSDIHVLAQKK